VELLRERILRDGKAINSDILLVDSFLNHQVDVTLMREIGRDFAEKFRDAGITRVMTIESSGIAPAAMTALELNVPLVIMKKSTSSILSEDVFQTGVHSFTKGTGYLLTLKARFVQPDDRVLFVDDFLANGEAALGAIRLIEGSGGAKVAGIGIVIEKAFQPGRERLMQAGFAVYAQARVRRMERDFIELCED
jgi:xanthine phosphoribosyltransferase